MTSATLNCSKCGGPIHYDGSDISTIQCPFCNSTNVVPKDMRPHKQPAIQVDVIQTGASPNNSGVIVLAVVAASIVLIGGILSVFIFSSGRDSESSAYTFIENPTATLPPTDTPEPSPTPAYAAVALTFGQEGMNPGQMQNARNIAISGDQWIITADYANARVQVFDMTGKFIRQWKTPHEKASIQGLTADRDGKVYVSTDGSIYVYEIETGEQLMELKSTDGGEYGDLAITPEGNLAAMWYEGRWGLITSLEGHSEALEVFGPDGTLVQRFASPLSSLTDELALDVYLTVDGKGNYYLMSSDVVYIISNDGVYRNKFVVYAPTGEELSVRSNIAVDGQGNLYVADSRSVVLLDENGHAVKIFPAQESVNYLALDPTGNLWTISGTSVQEYIKTGY